MRTIKIPVEIKKMMEEFGGGKSINKIVFELMDNTVLQKPQSEDGLGFINVNMDEELADALKEYSVYPTETYASILYRLLQSQKK